MNNTKNFFVSIIVNCFNGEKYLKQAIESILNQTHQNWELIFWDDQSTDSSRDIFHSYKDPRLKYYKSEKRKPLYHSRNDAIKKSNGEIIAFLDCDDWWLPQKLEKQLPFFLDKEIGVVYSKYIIINEFSKRKTISSKNSHSGFIKSKLLERYDIGILTTLLRKSIFDELNGFNNYYHIIGDFELNLRISEKWKFSGIQEVLAYYRVHGKNISLQNQETEINELEKLIISLKARNTSNEDIKNINNYLLYKKIFKNIIDKKKLEAFKKFIKLKNNFLKLKVLFMLLSPLFLVKKIKLLR